MQRPTKEQIRELPLYSGISLVDIKIIENEQDAIEALKQLRHEPCLGFDTESKPIFRKGEVSPGPTLIQLSTSSKAFLFPTKFPAALSAANKILANPFIKKVGFGLKGDNKELRSKLNIDILNTIDLSVKLKNLVGDKNQIGAQAAVAMVLKARLAKGAQMSNWGAYPLNNNQVLYAANDANDANDAHCAICIEQSLASLFD